MRQFRPYRLDCQPQISDKKAANGRFWPSRSPEHNVENRKANAMPAKRCLVGLTFTRLEVISDGPVYISPSGQRHSQSWCRCNCNGGLVLLRNSQMLSGKNKSCGCLRSELTASKEFKHGHNKRGQRTATYKAWTCMIYRCTNPNGKNWARYGGRGIKVCDRWLRSFDAFLADNGECPSGMEIDRWPNNDGDYEPGNTRWATMKQQARNTSRNRLVTLAGETLCVSEFVERFGLKYTTVMSRLNRGWSAEMAFTAVSK